MTPPFLMYKKSNFVTIVLISVAKLEYKYIMKKFLGESLIAVMLLSQCVIAADSGVVTLDKNSVEKPKITIDSNAKELKGSLLVNDSETLANLIDIQKEHDIKDLEKL